VPEIEITIPVFDEERQLESSLGKVEKFLKERGLSERVMIVLADNCSTDKTEEIANRIASAKDWVRYIRVDEKGVGLALKTSWLSSDAEIVGYMDLDLATGLDHLPEAFDALVNKGADIVYASRLHSESRVVGRSVKREMISRIFNVILRVYLGCGISDGMCGFKFLHRRHLSELMWSGAVSDGWFFSTELLVVGGRLGLRLYELPVRWLDDSSSKVRVVPLAISYLKAMRTLKSQPVHGN